MFFSDPLPNGYPLDKEYYRTAYRELAEEIRMRGARLFVVRGMESFLGGNTFSHGWEITEDGMKEHPKPLTVDLVYDKGYTFVPDAQTVLLNDPAMDTACTDKFETYRLFPSLCPVTERVDSTDDLPAALERIPGERIVLKPLDGEEGKGVFVVRRSEVTTTIPSYPYLLQEFLDLSDGIPGLVESTHDLRVTVINGEIILSFIRTPPPDSLLANVAQGGTKIEVPLEKIPADARAIVSHVDAAFSVYPRRVYSVDMGRTRSGSWKIIEINGKPGCTCREEGPCSARFLAALAEVLTS